MSKKNIGYFHAAVPSAALAAAVPYLATKKHDKETDEQFKARRRGLTAAAAAAGLVAGGHFIPPALLKTPKLKKTAGYFENQRRIAEDELKKQREQNKRIATMFAKEEELEARAKRRAERRKQGFTESGLISRGAQGLAGTAMLAKNIPLLGGAKGSQMLYHGTGVRGLQGILGEDADLGGMRLEYAGTKGRLNAALMPNAVVRQLLEDSDVDLSNAELAAVQTKINRAIRENQGTPIYQLIQDQLDEIGARNKIPAGTLDRLKTEAKDRLSEAGMRIYFGNSPEKVITWHDDAHEGQKILQQLGGVAGAGRGGLEDQLKTQLKMQLKVPLMAADVASGGIVDVAKSSKAQHDYLRNLNVHPEVVSREFIRDLATRGIVEDGERVGDFAHVLGANVPTADVEELADFKGIKTPLRLSTGLQGMLGNIPGFEGYDPSRDISTGMDVAQDSIRHVDMVNPKTGEATRYMLDSYRAPKLTGAQRLKSLGKASIPLALSGLGADMIYRAASGRKGVTGTLLSKFRKRRDEKKKKESTKTASKAHRPITTALKNVGKYGVPLVGLGAGLHIGRDAIGRAIVPVTEAEYAPESFSDDVEGLSREATRQLSGTAIKAGVSTALSLAGFAGGKALARRALHKRLPELARLAKAGDEEAIAMLKPMEDSIGMVGGGAGMMAPGLAEMSALLPAKAYAQAARGQDATRAELGETPEEQMKSPWKSAILPGLATLGIATAVGGSAAKHFPGLLRNAEMGALTKSPLLSPKRVKDHLDNALRNTSEGKAVPEDILSLAETVGYGRQKGLFASDHPDISDAAKRILETHNPKRKEMLDYDEMLEELEDY